MSPYTGFSPVEGRAEGLRLLGVKPMDALHVASVIEAGANWLLTTDSALLKKKQNDTHIRVAGPIDFVRALREGKTVSPPSRRR